MEPNKQTNTTNQKESKVRTKEKEKKNKRKGMQKGKGKVRKCHKQRTLNVDPEDGGDDVKLETKCRGFAWKHRALGAIVNKQTGDGPVKEEDLDGDEVSHVGNALGGLHLDDDERLAHRVLEVAGQDALPQVAQLDHEHDLVHATRRLRCQ